MTERPEGEEERERADTSDAAPAHLDAAPQDELAAAPSPAISSPRPRGVRRNAILGVLDVPLHRDWITWVGLLALVAAVVGHIEEYRRVTFELGRERRVFSIDGREVWFFATLALRVVLQPLFFVLVLGIPRRVIRSRRHLTPRKFAQRIGILVLVAAAWITLAVLVAPPDDDANAQLRDDYIAACVAGDVPEDVCRCAAYWITEHGVQDEVLGALAANDRETLVALQAQAFDACIPISRRPLGVQ